MWGQRSSDTKHSNQADQGSHRENFGPGSGVQVEVQVTPTVTPTVRTLLELLHKAGESGSTEIRKAFGLKDRVHIHKSYLQPALQSGYIEMTIPDKPNSRLQKYRLTNAGKRLLESMQK